MEQPKLQLQPAVETDRRTVYDLFAEVQSIHAAAEPDFFCPPALNDAFEAYFAGILSDPEQFLVLATLDGIAIGQVQYFIGTRPKNIYQLERRFAYINQLVVSRGYWRTGCGTALIDHVKREARKHTVPMLGVDFWSFNSAARSCFERSGFKVNQEHMWLKL